MSIQEDKILARDINVALDLMREEGSKPRDAAIKAMGRNNTLILKISEHENHITKIVSVLPRQRTKTALAKAKAKGTFLRRRAMSGARAAERKHQGTLKYDT